MRKLIVALGTVAALAGGARAEDPFAETIGTREESKEVQLHRWLFDTQGPDADMQGVCAGGAAQRVEVRRTAGDVAYGIFSLGWYTPIHVKVICTVPTR
jgi:hypothetical protein